MKTVLVILSLLFVDMAWANDRTLVFGVVPQQSASKLARLWSPILRYLGGESGLKLRFATARDIPTFERRLAQGEYDLAYMNPYHFTVFNRSPGYRAMARVEGKRIKGIMVVRKDSPIKDLGGFNHSHLAFPSPAAFAASILTRAHLSGLGIDYQPKYVSSHDSVYRAVAKGLYSGGGGVIRTFRNMAPEIRDQLRILWTSQGYTPHAFAAHPRVAQEDVDRLISAMLNMSRDERGRELLASVKMKGFERARDADWDDVRGLNIDLLKDLAK